MRKLIRALLLSFLAALAAPGRADMGTACPPTPEKPTPEAMQAAMRDAHDRGFLWRLSRDGRISWLYGTIHVAKLDWMMPGPTIMAALRDSDAVALELDLMDPDIQSRLSEGMTRLKVAPLPAALVSRVRRQAEAACLPYESLAGMPPEMQAITLSLVAGRWQGLDVSYGIDIVLAGIGHGARKNVVSLESAETQLKVMTMRNRRETESFVGASLDQIETGRARGTIERFAQAWANSDIAEMGSYERWCECLHTPGERAMMKRLLDDRNSGLARRIDELHASGKQVFAAVGALHLFGAKNLPALMEKRGYKVERVEFAAP